MSFYKWPREVWTEQEKIFAKKHNGKIHLLTLNIGHDDWADHVGLKAGTIIQSEGLSREGLIVRGATLWWDNGLRRFRPARMLRASDLVKLCK